MLCILVYFRSLFFFSYFSQFLFISFCILVYFRSLFYFIFLHFCIQFIFVVYFLFSLLFFQVQSSPDDETRGILIGTFLSFRVSSPHNFQCFLLTLRIECFSLLGEPFRTRCVSKSVCGTRLSLVQLTLSRWFLNLGEVSSSCLNQTLLGLFISERRIVSLVGFSLSVSFVSDF